MKFILALILSTAAYAQGLQVYLTYTEPGKSPVYKLATLQGFVYDPVTSVLRPAAASISTLHWDQITNKPTTWDWSKITNRPTIPAPVTTLPWKAITGKPALWDWANISNKPATWEWSQITGTPAIPPPVVTLAWEQITGRPAIPACPTYEFDGAWVQSKTITENGATKVVVTLLQGSK